MNSGLRDRILPVGREIVHFGLSSCGCFVIDKAVFTAVCLPMQHAAGRATAIAVAIVLARTISGHCNYFYNRRFVFKAASSLKSYWQYWSLAIVNLGLSMLATECISAWIDAKGLAISAVNVGADVVLFLFSYSMQRFFIFMPPKDRH